MYFFKYIVIVAFVFLSLEASELDTLLNNFNHKNDLSQKTIDENKGHLVLYNRDRLERMHAKTLKDVFKTTPVIYYHENRYGLPDPLTSGAFEPYRSNFIRLYIDGVEITQGWMGSGIVLYGNINIDFVDHIEFYYAVPSFETSVEPAYLTIFLYSKDPKRDSGANVTLTQGSRGHNEQSINYGEQKETYAYMINLSHTDAKREKIDNGTNTALSRDFERTQLFSYLKTDTQAFHLQVIKQKSDRLAGLSLDATPLRAEDDYLNLHMDYAIDFSSHWHAQIAYDWLSANILQEDDYPLAFSQLFPVKKLEVDLESSTYSAELTYKNTLGKHRVVTGIKARTKKLDRFVNNGQKRDAAFNEESIASLFLQDQYALSDKELLTLGVEYSKIYRNGNVQNDDLLQLRLGYIYTSEQWSYKAYLYRTMFALDPLGRYSSQVSTTKNVSTQITRGVTQEISYKDDTNYMRLMFLIMKDENGLLENNHKGNTKYFFGIFNYDYSFDMDNKIDLQLYYARYNDIFNLDTLEDYSGYLSFSNTYDDLQFYNAVVWHQNSINHKLYFDVTSSISYEINENLTLTLKGQNILGKAKETNLYRINPSNGKFLSPLSISPIDQRITLEAEYRF
jgi:iron complex outermembrane receptor protein